MPRFIQFQPLSPSSKEEVARRFNWRPWGRDGEQHPKPVHPTMTLDEGDEARIEDLQLIQSVRATDTELKGGGEAPPQVALLGTKECWQTLRKYSR